MKYRVMSCFLTLALLLAPVTVLAAKGGGGEDEDTVKQEARLEGYATPVHLPSGGNTLTAMMFVFLSVLALCTLLKNAKRTHLD